MSHEAPQHVQVRVPATTANLGCGFDILGLALQLYNSFTFTRSTKPGWHVKLPPGITLPANSTNLVFRAARRLFERVGFHPTHLCLALDIHIPLTRGLGSSSSAIVGGLVAEYELPSVLLLGSTERLLCGKSLQTVHVLALVRVRIQAVNST